MRKFSGQKDRLLEEVRCNCCGRSLTVKNGILEEGCIHAEPLFGYFSKKDGQQHSFDLCEDCYDKIRSDFQIPVEIEEKTELL